MKLLFVIYIAILSAILFLVVEKDITDQDYATIKRLIKSSEVNSVDRKIYLNAFLKKAEAENNWKQIVAGYKNYLHHSPIKHRIVYADIMIIKALQSEDKHLISSSYLTKGVVYYHRKEYEKAMDNYGIANRYFLESKKENPYLKYKISYNIGLINYSLEQFDDALLNLGKCQDYFETEYKRAYLNTLHLIGLCYRSKGNYEKASDLNQLGIQKGKEMKIPSMEVYFKHSEAIIQYFRKNYDVAIHSLQKVIPSIEKSNDFANVTLGQYYIGKSYWALGKSEDAISYLASVDESFTTKGYLKNEIVDAYDDLINYYKSINNQEMQQCYTQQSDTAKSVLISRSQRLFPKINKEYNLANISQETESILARKKRNEKLFILSLLLLSISWYFLNNHYKGVYKEQYERLKNHVLQVKSPKPVKISKDVKQSVLGYLDNFEKEKQYLNKNLRLPILASSCKTNPYYLSQIIIQEKGKKYTDYVNDLKLSYIIEIIKKDKKFRKMSIQGLADEAYFASVQNFGKVFKLKTGVSPYEFIKGLENKTSDEA